MAVNPNGHHEGPHEDPEIRHYQHIYILVVLFGGCLVQHAASALTELVASSSVCCLFRNEQRSYISAHLAGLDSID